VTFDHVTKRERTISGALALGMHLLFLVLLVAGVSWQQKRPDSAVFVELWSELPPTPRPKAEPPPPEPPRQAPRPEPRPEPKPELKPLPKPDIALNEKLIKERKQKEEREKAEQERKQKEQKLAKENLEKERKLKEQKQIEEKKRKEKELAEEKRKKEIAEAERKEKEFQDALRKREQQAAESAAQAKLDAYKRSVSEKIKRYIVLPPSIQGNPEAQFEVVQIPGGEILTVRLKRSSGNPAYDAAVERAIHKAQPLPPPPDPARFSEVRELELKFRPKE
jgi:colicin import membrane protein